MGGGAGSVGNGVVMGDRYLALRLEAPMAAFGDVMIDSLGPIRDTPAVSAISGLLANALGLRREQTLALSRLQERLVIACRIDHAESRFTDFQTAQLGANDRWWTTDGRVQERAGGANTFDSPHIRERDYDCDVRMLILLRLRDAAETPTLDDVAQAVQWPARPLFLGRKCCLPSAPLFVGFVDAVTAFEALRGVPLFARRSRSYRNQRDELSEIVVTLPPDDPCPEGFHTVYATEWRDWPAGVHAGEQRRHRGSVARAEFAQGEAS